MVPAPPTRSSETYHVLWQLSSGAPVRRRPEAFVEECSSSSPFSKTLDEIKLARACMRQICKSQEVGNRPVGAHEGDDVGVSERV